MITRFHQNFPLGIRGQLTCWYTMAFAILLLLTGAVFYNYLEQSLEASVDTDLQIRAQQIAGEIISGKGTMVASDGTMDQLGIVSPTNATLIQPVDVNYGVLVRLLDVQGKLLGETPAFRTLQVPAASVAQPLVGEPWQGTVHTKADQEVRLYSRVLTVKHKSVVVIQVGESLASLHSLLHRLVGALLVTGFLVLLACAAGSYWLAARSLAPIQRLAELARYIKAGDLSQRVAVPRAHDEIQYLALTLNEMIGSLDQTFSNQRRFVADASHELRTPVAVIRNKVDITLLEPFTLQEATTVLYEIRGETERLSHLISDLLTLARSDEGQVPCEREPVQFDILVKTVAETLEVLVAERSIQLDVQAYEPVVLIGDEARLIQVVVNLLDNAIRYTNPGGCIWVTVEKMPSAARLVIRDNGIGIAPEHLAHIFKRFYRAAPSHGQAGGSGSGLGLAIVEWIVRMHGGSVEVESRLGWGTTFTVTLPLPTTIVNRATLRFPAGV